MYCQEYLEDRIEAKNPLYAMRISLRDDLFPRGFTEPELQATYMALTDTVHDCGMLLETASFESIDEYYNPGIDDIAPEYILEAIVVDKFSKTERRMAAVVRVLNKHLKSTEITAQEAIVGKPRKRGQFAYVTVQLPFSDGQVVSIIFHAPEGDRMKITPSDKIIAFQWLLNKRDITHVVAPEEGAEVSLETIAKRVTQLVVKNSARFERTQKEAVAERRALDEAREALKQAEDRQSTLMASIVTVSKDAETVTAELQNTLALLEKQRGINAELQARLAALRKAQQMQIETGGQGGSGAGQGQDETDPNNADRRGLRLMKNLVNRGWQVNYDTATKDINGITYTIKTSPENKECVLSVNGIRISAFPYNQINPMRVNIGVRELDDAAQKDAKQRAANGGNGQQGDTGAGTGGTSEGERYNMDVERRAMRVPGSSKVHWFEDLGLPSTDWKTMKNVVFVFHEPLAGSNTGTSKGMYYTIISMDDPQSDDYIRDCRNKGALIYTNPPTDEDIERIGYGSLHSHEKREFNNLTSLEKKRRFLREKGNKALSGIVTIEYRRWLLEGMSVDLTGGTIGGTSTTEGATNGNTNGQGTGTDSAGTDITSPTGNNNQPQGTEIYAAQEEAREKLSASTNGVVTKEEIKQQEENLRKFITDVDNGQGKSLTREEIFEKFDNSLKPIATLPSGYLQYFSGQTNNPRIYCSQAHFIDHAINHHPELSIEEYKRIQDIISNPDDVKRDTRIDQDSNKSRDTLLFIKKYDKNRVVAISVEVDPESNGNLVFYRTLIPSSKKKPYASLPSVGKVSVDGAPSNDGVPTIGPTGVTPVPRGSRLSARDGSNVDANGQNVNPTTPPFVTTLNEILAGKYDGDRDAAMDAFSDTPRAPLAELKGTERQIKWAEEIRKKILEDCETHKAVVAKCESEIQSGKDLTRVLLDVEKKFPQFKTYFTK